MLRTPLAFGSSMGRRRHMHFINRRSGRQASATLVPSPAPSQTRCAGPGGITPVHGRRRFQFTAGGAEVAKCVSGLWRKSNHLLPLPGLGVSAANLGKVTAYVQREGNVLSSRLCVLGVFALCRPSQARCAQRLRLERKDAKSARSQRRHWRKRTRAVRSRRFRRSATSRLRGSRGDRACRAPPA
jgi:hypothetical protein